MSEENGDRRFQLRLASRPRGLCEVLFLARVPPQLNSEHSGGVDGALQGPPGAVLAFGDGEGPAPPAGPRAEHLQVHAHQDVLHILIKVPPGWL